MTTNSDKHQAQMGQASQEAASPTGPIFEVMTNFFKEDDWPVVKVEDQPVLRVNFQGDNGQWSCVAQARESEQQFVFYSLCPINAPPEKRLAIAEFITRANYGLITGNFEMDFSDGEIRYKTSIDVEGDRLSQALVKQLVYANVMIMDNYLPGILKVIYGDLSSHEAVALVEE